MSLEEAKRLGNEHLKAGRLGEAVAQYSECITLAPNDAVYWSNRSAAYAALQRWDEALADGHTAADLRPDWSKAHSVRHRRVQSPSPSNSSYPRALPARLRLEHPRSWTPAPCLPKSRRSHRSSDCSRRAVVQRIGFALNGMGKCSEAR